MMFQNGEKYIFGKAEALCRKNVYFESTQLHLEQWRTMEYLLIGGQLLD
jgi:hypothetical protein